MIDTKQFLTGSWCLILPVEITRHEAIKLCEGWGLKMSDTEKEIPEHVVLQIDITGGEYFFFNFAGIFQSNATVTYLPLSLIQTN